MYSYRPESYSFFETSDCGTSTISSIQLTINIYALGSIAPNKTNTIACVGICQPNLLQQKLEIVNG